MGIRPCFCIVDSEADQQGERTSLTPVDGSTPSAFFDENRQVTVTVGMNQQVLLNGFASARAEVQEAFGVGRLTSAFLTLQLFRDLDPLALLEENFDKSTVGHWAGSASVSWIDNPGPGTFTYTLNINVSFTADIGNNSLGTFQPIVNSRGLNAIVYNVGV